MCQEDTGKPPEMIAIQFWVLNMVFFFVNNFLVHNSLTRLCIITVRLLMIKLVGICV